MSSVRIRHYGKGGWIPLGKCSHPNCERQADEIMPNGQVRCSQHLTLELRVVARAIRPGQRIGR